MGAALAACQALVKDNVKSQTIKSPGGIEVQVILADPGGEVKEALNKLQLWQRVCNKAIPIHNVKLLHGKVLQPTLQMFGVDAGPDCFVFRVHLAGVGVNDQLLKLVVGLVFALLALQHLGIVRHSSGGRLAHDDQQLDGRVHLEYPFRDFLCDEVSRALFNGDLMREGEGHFPPVPVDATSVILVIVKEVDLL